MKTLVFVIFSLMSIASANATEFSCYFGIVARGSHAPFPLDGFEYLDLSENEFETKTDIISVNHFYISLKNESKGTLNFYDFQTPHDESYFSKKFEENPETLKLIRVKPAVAKIRLTYSRGSEDRNMIKSKIEIWDQESGEAGRVRVGHDVGGLRAEAEIYTEREADVRPGFGEFLLHSGCNKKD